MKIGSSACVVGLAFLACAGTTKSAEVAYKNGAWTWEDGSWVGGIKPGPDDTALIPELPVLKMRYDAGKMQSNGLTSDEEISSLRFCDLYGMSVQGQYVLTLNNIVCDDLSPSPEDTAQAATNKVGVKTIQFKGEAPYVFVGEKHVLACNTLLTSQSTAGLVKTGAGELLIGLGDKYNGLLSMPLTVQEGTVIKGPAGSPQIGGHLRVGGYGKPARYILQQSVAQGNNTLAKTSELEVLPQGEILFEDSPKEVYLEYMKLDHGTFNAGMKQFTMVNDASTNRGTEYVFKGGVFTNGTILVIYGGSLTIEPSDVASALYGTLMFNTGYDIDVPDGSAPVDFLVSGDLVGSNRGINKTGDGTMVIRCDDHISTWGWTAGRRFDVKCGELYVESSETGIGMGTNNVSVVAGGTYGGVGQHVGSPIENRALAGNLAFNGEADNPATFAIGRKNIASGVLEPGKFILGSEEQTNNVTFVNEGVLKIGVSTNAVSQLVVNGLFTLSGNDTLALVGPDPSAKFTGGNYEVVTTKEPMNAPFAEVTYNGGALPSGMKVRQEPRRILLSVPVKGLSVVVR